MCITARSEILLKKNVTAKLGFKLVLIKCCVQGKERYIPESEDACVIASFVNCIACVTDLFPLI